jgi:hypothetical protein
MSDTKEEKENTEKTRTSTIETRGVGAPGKDDKATEEKEDTEKTRTSTIETRGVGAPKKVDKAETGADESEEDDAPKG